MLGEEKPYKPPQQNKKPRLAISVRSSGPAGLRTTSCLLRCLATLGTTASFLSLLRPGFTISQLYLANCLPYLIIISYILTIPQVLSLVITFTIYAIPFPPLRPIKGIRGFIYKLIYYHQNIYKGQPSTRRKGQLQQWLLLPPITFNSHYYTYIVHIG